MSTHPRATMVGAVIVPHLRVARHGSLERDGRSFPAPRYLERFPPAGLTVFGFTPSGPVSLRPQLLAGGAPRGAPRDRRRRGRSPAATWSRACGHQFPEGTRLAARVGPGGHRRSKGDLTWIRSAGAPSRRGRPASVGVELVLAPVADVNTRRDNPIISTRSFGDRAPSAPVSPGARLHRGACTPGGAAGLREALPRSRRHRPRTRTSSWRASIGRPGPV